MGVIPKEKKHEVLLEIGEILDRYCYNCQLYLDNIKNNGKKYAIQYCHEICEMGEKMHRLAESISPFVEGQDDDDDFDLLPTENKKSAKYKPGEVTKEWLVKKLNSGLTYEEIALQLNRKKEIITYYKRKYKVVKKIGQGGRVYYE